MRLTLQTDYSLRVLMYLAVNQEKLVTIQEISDCYDISRNHLMKVVHHLGKHKYIETIRGKNGGMRLGREPSTINIGALVRKTEPDMAIVQCMGKGGICKLQPSCHATNIFSEALMAFLQVLSKYSLEDLIAGSAGITSLLQAIQNETGK